MTALRGKDFLYFGPGDREREREKERVNSARREKQMFLVINFPTAIITTQPPQSID